MGTGTELGRVRGLGAAGSSSTWHWWRQRVTAISNFALMTWFIVSLIRLPDLGYRTVVTWLHQPLAAIPMLLLIGSVFYHFRLGIQVMIEDYVDDEGNKVLSVLLLNLYVLVLAFTAAFCVLKIAFGAV
jgi:succinate dehydrogenase / fumarate reductase membrane anchor subunit